jgi:probable HAF family extracellular repeat protein
MKTCRLGAVTACAIFIGLIATIPKSHAQTYRVTDLGASTVGTAINNAGQVVGYTYAASGPNQPFLWSNGTLTNLATLGGTAGEAFGINSSGQVVGQSNIAGDAYHHATLWSAGTITDLGTFNNICCFNSRANAINDTGQIVGTTDISCGPPGSPPECGMLAVTEAPFIFTGGAMTLINGTNLGMGGGATGINNSGQIAGYAEAQFGYIPDTAVFWSASTSVPSLLFPLNPFTVTPNSHPILAINNLGEVATQAPANANAIVYTATLWNNGTVTNLGALYFGCPPATGLNCDTGAYGVNNSGQIVGYGTSWQLVDITIVYTSFAALWSGGQFSDLNMKADPSSLPGPFNLSYAAGINDNGLILAVGDYASATHTFLLQLESLSLSLTPTSLTFASEPAGKQSVAQVITVNNNGPTPFGFNPMVLTGDFSQTNDCGASLAVGSSCSIRITFTPTAPGTQTGMLTVASGGTSYPVNLTGTGTISVALGSSAPTTLVGTAVTLTWAAPGTTCVATGGSVTDGWTGNLPGSGSTLVTESAPGKYTYGVSCTGGGQTGTAQVTVTVGLPTVSLAAAPSTVSVGQASTLTWTSTFAIACTASGGGSGDGWSGTRATSGTVSVTESTSGTYTYTLTCSSGGKTGQGVAVVTVNAKPTSGGGGAIDRWSLLSLISIIGFGYWRRVTSRYRNCRKSLPANPHW